MLRKKTFIFLVFLIITASSAAASFMLDRVVAIVNQDVISWSELYRSMQTDATPAVKAMAEEERMKIFKENESVFLENLINFKLQVQEAATLGFRVSEEEVNETIAGIRAKYKMTDAQFQASLKSEGFEFYEYKKRLSEQIIVGKLVNQYIRGKVLVAESDVDKFLAENRNFGSGTEALRLRQIFFKKAKDESGRMKVEEKASAAYARALKGEDFAELARQYSEDSTRESGGDLGYVEKGILAKEFSAALSGLKTGDVSRPFWSDRGMHILKVEDKSAAKSSADIREDARRTLQESIFNEKYKGWLKSLREKAFIDIRL